MFGEIDIKQFEERTGNRLGQLGLGWGSATKVIGLRDMAQVESLALMPKDYLERMLHNVRLADAENGEVFPYAGCRIDCLRLDPAQLLVGQTFVQRDKYRRILECFSTRLSRFTASRGIAKLTALIAFGSNDKGEPCLAHYVPPIVEEYRGQIYLLDGIHRHFLVMQVGSTIESLVIRNVGQPPPFDPDGWSIVRPVESKPPLPDRYRNLCPELFRDVKDIGIDG